MRCKVVSCHCLLVLAGSMVAQAADINGYPAPAGSYTGGFKGAFTGKIYESDPAADSISGQVSFSFQFQVPVFPPPTKSECDPSAPVVKPGGCNHGCVKKDGYMLYQSEPLAGVPVIWTTPTCEAPIAGPVTPLDPATARKACVSQAAWGGTAKTAVTLKIGPLYQFNHPRTVKTATGWEYDNKANVVWPYVIVNAPVSIQCVAGPQAARQAEPSPVLDVRLLPEQQMAVTRDAPAQIPPQRAPSLQAVPALMEYEAETLLASGAVRVSGGDVRVQAMAAFGRGWSGGEQLFWSGAPQGATLDLLAGVPADSKYAVEIYMTRAPDYGKLRFEVDGQPSETTFDGMAPEVMTSGPIQLGTFALRAGQRRLSLTITGKYAQATNYYVGIDKLRLYPAGPID